MDMQHETQNKARQGGESAFMLDMAEGGEIHTGEIQADHERSQEKHRWTGS